MARWDVNFDFILDHDDHELIKLHAEIDSYRLSIGMLSLPPSVRRELNQNNMIRQIQGTTGIEGNSLTAEQIQRALQSDTAKKEEELEVVNAHKAQEYIREHSKSSSTVVVTDDLVRTLHAINTNGLYGDRNEPGLYRQFDVSAGDYHAPFYGDIQILMQKFVEMINSRRCTEGLGPLIRSMIAHFYLITIHPFGDGNGRTSRALEAYILYGARYNVLGFYSLSNYHYRHRNDYIRELNHARFVDNGNLTRFVKYCMSAFLHELKGIQEVVNERLKEVMFRDYVLEKQRFGEINSRMGMIVELVSRGVSLSQEDFRNFSNPLLRSIYENLTIKTAQRDLKKLIELNLIRLDNRQLKANLAIMDQFMD